MSASRRVLWSRYFVNKATDSGLQTRDYMAIFDAGKKSFLKSAFLMQV
jgi:hypothetical protein